MNLHSLSTPIHQSRYDNQVEKNQQTLANETFIKISLNLEKMCVKYLLKKCGKNQQTDMLEDMKQEAIEVTVTAVEKYSDNYENAAQMVKDNLDKKFGKPFNVVIGEAYSFSITYQEKSMLLLFTNGNVAALIWRTVPG